MRAGPPAPRLRGAGEQESRREAGRTLHGGVTLVRGEGRDVSS